MEEGDNKSARNEDERREDPLASPVEIEQDESHESSTQQYTPEELQEILTQRQEMVVDEDMDPLEWTVRKVVPIPRVYYWDVVPDQAERASIPWKIRAWHSTIAGCCRVGNWMDRRVAQPIARGVGLTDSRFDYDPISIDQLLLSKETIREFR